MIRKQDDGRSGSSRWLRATMVFLSGAAFVGAAACAGGEEVPLFENAGGKSGGSGGHAGTSVGTSGSTNNGGSGGAGQGGSGQGGTGQGGSGQGGSGQGGSGQGGSAGIAMAGASGAGGNAGSAQSDSGVPDAATFGCNALALAGTPVTGKGVTLQYQNAGGDPADATIAFLIEITASTTLALNQLEVRYFLTNEVTSPSMLEVYYAGAGNSGTDIKDKIQRSVVAAALGAGGDSYLKYTINDNGSVAAGEKIKLNPAFHPIDYLQKFNECNDYSYDSSATSMKDNPRIAVYLNGTLIWGTTPAGSTPDGGTDAAPSDAAVEGAASDAAVEGAASDAPADQSVSDAAAADVATEATGD